MKAMVFAAGLGTRLRPLTNDRPKALVELAGVPMLERVIKNLIRHGIDDITVNVHHFADKVIDFIASKQNFGVNIHISDERDLLLDTGGGILRARQYLDGNEPFIVHNADILTDLNLTAMYQAHVEGGAEATLLTKWRQTQRYILFDKTSRRMCGWVNKATGETRPDGFVYSPERYDEFAFGGVHILSPTIFPYLEKYRQTLGNEVFGIMPFYISMCREALIQGYEGEDGYRWFDIGKPETLALAEQALTIE